MLSKSKKIRFVFTTLLLFLLISLYSQSSSFAQTQKYILNLTAPKILLGDGVKSATITAKVTDLKKKPVSGAEVSFLLYSGQGSLSEEFATTDDSGNATTSLTSATPGSVYIRADIADAKLKGKRIVKIIIKKSSITTAFKLTITTDQKSIQAKGSTATITALLRNRENNPIKGAVITFKADHGTIASSATTDENGNAKATLTSDDFNGDVTVTARYSNLLPATVTVKFVVTGMKLSLSLSTNTIANDGTTAAITAILADSANNPIADKTIKFSNALDVDGDGTISSGDTLNYATLSASSGTTDADGKITGITISSVNTGSVVIKAEVGDAVVYKTLTVVAPAEVKSVAVTSNDAKIMVNGGTTLITAKFINITSGTATFTTTLGYFKSAKIIPIDVAIDSSGTATATLTAGSKTGIAEVKVSTLVNATTGQRVEGSILVKIASAAAKKIELSASPNNIAINIGVSTITARVKDANGNPVADALVGFAIVNSPGGTGLNNTSQLSASVVTDSDGIATVKFFAGALETPTFNGVRIDAFLTGDNENIKDTTYLTISGKPSFISITFADAPSTNDDSSLTLPITAIVSDIHGNPVADDTPVSLGVVITRLAKVKFSQNEPYFTDGKVFNTEDLNGNGVLDPGEDTNNNGVLDFIEDVNGNGILDPGEDLNGNGVLDRSKSLDQINVIVSPSSSPTKDGVAKGTLSYGQGFMERYQVLISAEAGGIVNTQYLVLPHTLREVQVGTTTDKTKLIPTDQTAFTVTDTTGKDTPPAGPTALSATLISGGRVSLQWTDNSNNETGFEIWRSTTSGSGFVQIANSSDVGPNTDPTSNIVSYIDSTASVGTVYFYKVRAVNLNGDSNYSGEASTSTPRILPPSNLTASAGSSNQIVLNWTDNSNNEIGFTIERSFFDGTTLTAFTEIARVGKDVTFYRDGLISPAITYFYRVKAFAEDTAEDIKNGVKNESLYSNEVSHELFAFAPSNLISTTTTTPYNLTWKDNSDNETGFEIERSESFESGFTKIGTVAANITTYSDTTAVANTTYYYRVRATISGGRVSGYSNVISPTGPTINSPSDLVATGYSSLGPPEVHGISLSWTDNSTNEVGFFVEEKTVDTPTYKEVLWVPANSGTGAMGITVIGLTVSSQHFYRIRAFNGSTVSDYSNESGAIVP